MIRLRLRLDHRSIPAKLEVSGHEKANGHDFAACNAVSALLQTYHQSVISLVNENAVTAHDDGQVFVLNRNSTVDPGDRENFIWSVLTRSFLIGIQGVQKASEAVTIEIENLEKE
jgi:uncharacterized protein YsxB (DUF464 family)